MTPKIDNQYRLAMSLVVRDHDDRRSRLVGPLQTHYLFQTNCMKCAVRVKKMKCVNRILIILMATVGIAGGIQPVRGAEPKRLAFLIGINTYEKRGFAEQKCAESDVKALAKELTLHQFKVVTLT